MFDVAALEASVARCPICAAALAREARLEVALHDVAAAVTMGDPERVPQTPPIPGARARPRLRLRRATAAAFASALALAAGYLLWIARSSDDIARAAERSSLVACPPGTGGAAASCHAHARRMGLFVQDPPRSAPVPIYEAR